MKKILVIFSLSLFTIVACTKTSTIGTDGSDSQVNPFTAKAVGAASISGVNWADPRDNFVDDAVVPSGLSSGDSYATVVAKTDAILNGFTSKISGVNTIRIPINPISVINGAVWWGRYKGVIDKATSKGWKVIICCWDSKTNKNGSIDNMTNFWSMWTTIVNAYQSNSNVFFEVFNEPHSYSLSALTTIYADFLSRYSGVPKGRVLLDGTGAASDVTGVGADSRFTSCLLSLHDYAFNANHSTGGWEARWRSKYGSYASRTVITEFGVPMDTGKDYQNGSQADDEIAFMVATSNVCRIDKVASIYWPGLRDGDSYSLFTRGGTGTSITLNTVNASGVFRVRYGWGL